MIKREGNLKSNKTDPDKSENLITRDIFHHSRDSSPKSSKYPDKGPQGNTKYSLKDGVGRGYLVLQTNRLPNSEQFFNGPL
ncbi:hypothetical protein NPIL_528301 [Nephila pilipes]|uniref:Uncharacterized protein n=1 Tax=Nephila pilipes TaxID=299642 RepID=A0A8X6QZ12_NEPPI|nr:hypothetical protein NPIL_528301 [Nephila pilipes]